MDSLIALHVHTGAPVLLSAYTFTRTPLLKWYDKLQISSQRGWLHVDIVFVKLQVLLGVYMYIYLLSYWALPYGKSVYNATVIWQFKNNLHFFLLLVLLNFLTTDTLVKYVVCFNVW